MALLTTLLHLLQALAPVLALWLIDRYGARQQAQGAALAAGDAAAKVAVVEAAVATAEASAPATVSAVVQQLNKGDF